MKKPGLFYPAILLIQVFLLTAAVSSWWVQRNNHLFGNKNWVVGKNTGKFVFYTYDFMFRNLVQNEVDLGTAQGFQEILYKQAEDEAHRLSRLRFDTSITENAYVWILLQKEGLRTLGIRLSRSSPHRSGFFEFSDRGDLKRFEPFSGPVNLSKKGWNRVEVSKTNGTLHVSLNRSDLGSFDPEIDSGGSFGFRGSGRARSKVLVRKIRGTFEDPSRPGKGWDFEEKFEPRLFRKDVLYAAGLLSLLVVLLRLFRGYLFAGFLDADQRRRFISRDLLNFSAFSLLAIFLPMTPSGLKIPAMVMFSELFTLILFIRSVKRRKQASRPSLYTGGVFALVAIGLSLGAIQQHGPWLGRATRSIWAKMEQVDPHAFILIPAKQEASGPFSREEPLKLLPGRSFFVEGQSYKEQEIELEFTLSDSGTLDIAFQQQAYQTHGDPGGEELPLQRRLVRVSTRNGVPYGFSMEKRKQPAPFLRIQGPLFAGESNRIKIVSDSKGVTIELNDSVTEIPGYLPIGFGETGFMVYDDEATLANIHVRPLEEAHLKTALSPVKGLELWLGFLLGGFLLFRIFGKVPIFEVGSLLCAGTFPLLFYLSAALVVAPDTLAYLGSTRFIWLDCALVGSVLMLMPVVVVQYNRLKFPPILFNLLFLLLIMAGLLLTWDLLPAGHPMRYKFEKSSVAPGEVVKGSGSGGAWYSNNRLIGANNYVWKQKFGPEAIPEKKEKNTIRVFAMGGSQAWGSGAASSLETYDALLELRLKKKGLQVEIFNAGVNGAGIGKTFVLADGLLMGFQPDILVADIGLNDSAAIYAERGEERQARHREYLINNFRDFIQLCQKHDVMFILVQEAMSRESPLRPDEAFYEAVKKMTTEAGFPVVDAIAPVWEKEADHMVWWDTAHYAPYGHELLADIIEPALEAAVRKRMK